VIVGKSMSQDGESSKCFGFVNRYDTKPKGRLFEMLKFQGMQMNQAVTFLSDGGDTVRDLQQYLNPQAEHLLDWFHISMRLTVMSQLRDTSRNGILRTLSLSFRERALLEHRMVLFHAGYCVMKTVVFTTHQKDAAPRNPHFVPANAVAGLPG
jgi:hypothetical protein